MVIHHFSTFVQTTFRCPIHCHLHVLPYLVEDFEGSGQSFVEQPVTPYPCISEFVLRMPLAKGRM